jgi:hypothetical protein
MNASDAKDKADQFMESQYSLVPEFTKNIIELLLKEIDNRSQMGIYSFRIYRNKMFWLVKGLYSTKVLDLILDNIKKELTETYGFKVYEDLDSFMDRIIEVSWDSAESKEHKQKSLWDKIKGIFS